MTHDAVVVDGYRCASATKVNEGDSVLHLGFVENNMGSSISGEIFLDCREGISIHQLLSFADEYLEVTFEGVTGHTYDISLLYLEAFTV